MQAIYDAIGQLLERGGWVMYPLIALSIISLTLIFERLWFWWRTNNPQATARLSKIANLLRTGNADAAREMVSGDTSVYGRLIDSMLEQGAGEAAVTEAVEIQRPRLERFMPTLNTVITAAPLLGILGTVTGIIGSLNVMSDEGMVTDPTQLAGPIAEALLTTVAGLGVALVVLFPYNAFQAQIDRTLGRIEGLVAAHRSADEED